MPNDYVRIKGKAQGNFALTANTSANSVALPAGQYDVWSDVEVYVRTASVARNGVLTASPFRAQDVTLANGYPVFIGNVVTFDVQEGDAIGAISASGGTLRFMQTG